MLERALEDHRAYVARARELLREEPFEPESEPISEPAPVPVETPVPSGALESAGSGGAGGAGSTDTTARYAAAHGRSVLWRFRASLPNAPSWSAPRSE